MLLGSTQRAFATMATQRTERKRCSSLVPSFLWSMNPRNFSFKSVLSETWLVLNLAFELLYYLGSRLIWIWMFFRFLLYVSLLMVPFIRAGYVCSTTFSIQISLSPHICSYHIASILYTLSLYQYTAGSF